jgi:ComEC/Rec2-related protein
MLCFAVAVMAGATAMRIWPEWADWLSFGWLAAAVPILFWLVLPPAPAVVSLHKIPEGYARHILPRPGFFARRGLNTFMLLAGILFFLTGAWRQVSWQSGKEAGLNRLPREIWFNATFTALEPCRLLPDGGAWRVKAVLVSANDGANVNLPVRLSGPAGIDFRRGDIILTRVRREELRQPAYPGAFDFSLWLERDGMFASFAVARPREANRPLRFQVVGIDSPPFPIRIRRHIDALRIWAIGAVRVNGGDQGAVLAAMLFGYRDDMDRELRDTFRRVGIGHVLAISGLHVGLVVGLFWWISGWLSLSGRIRAAACLVLSLVYLGLAGGQVAASRATLMACIHFSGIMVGRRSDMLNSLGAAAFILTLANPASPMDVSFQLSFTAIIFIHAGLEMRDTVSTKRFQPRSARQRLAGGATALVRLSIATWAGLFPIIAMVFNQINLVGLPINIIVIPLMSLVLAGGLMLPCLGWIPGCGPILSFPAVILERIAHWADTLPYSSFPSHGPSKSTMLAFYFAAALFLIRKMMPAGKWRKCWRNISAGLLILSFVGLFASMKSFPPPAGGRIVVLPGWGFGSIVVETETGGLAVLGTIARGGQDEAGWLHSQRRSGAVGVVAIGRPREGRLYALAYHFGIAAAIDLENTVREFAGRRSGWLPIPETPGAEYAFRRDLRGRLLWLAARIGKRSVCVAPFITPNQVEMFRDDAIRLGFRLIFLGGLFRDGADPPVVIPDFKVPVVFFGRPERIAQPSWLSRREYGVISLADDLAGFDGRVWRLLTVGSFRPVVPPAPMLPDGLPADGKNPPPPGQASASPLEDRPDSFRP